MYGYCVETIELYNKENAEEEETKNQNRMGEILGKEILGFSFLIYISQIFTFR